MEQKRRPNILWICTDQQRYDTIRALGNQHINTPNIDRLVQEGVAFTHAFCQAPICTPSRASFLTGKYPSTLHACMNGNDRWADAAPLVTKRLADSGYDCGLAGKLHLSHFQPFEVRFDDGYRVFHWSHDSRDNTPLRHDYAEWTKSQGHPLAELRKDPAAIPPKLHQTTWCADRAIEFIESHQPDEPWLMSVNPFDPHAPFDPPQEYLDRYDADQLPGPLFRESDLHAQTQLANVQFQNPVRRPEEFHAREVIAAYYAMIELIDENVGRMLDALERTGMREHTLVIFTSDHGEMLGDHGLLLKGCRFYEGLVRVPLIFSWPGRVQAGVTSDALVELTDIVPTLLDFCGLKILPDIQGRSLAPLLTGQAPLEHHRDVVRTEYYDALPSKGEPTYGTMIRDRRHKLVVYHGHELGELFDLEADPGEFVNLWDDPAYRDVRFNLMKRSFDALAFAVDVGPERRPREA